MTANDQTRPVLDDKTGPTIMEEKAIEQRIENADNVETPGNRLAQAQCMSEEEFLDIEKKLKRKLDIRLVACVMVIYTLNFLDRNNIAAAKVAGIEKSLHLSSTQFSTAVSILFVGYVLMQVPSNIFLAQLRPSIYISACMAAWGTVSTCTGATQSAGGLYATRFVLGFIEAALFPGVLFLLSSWYKRSELGLRCALLYTGSAFGSATSGLIAAGITSGLNGARGLPAWRWIFIIEGSVTVFIALTAIFILPDFPSNTRWLTPQERAVAEWRLIKDAGQVDEDDGSWSEGFKSAFCDWRLYVFALMFFCVLVTTSTQNFFPTVVGTLGFGKIETLLLTVPPYAVGAIFMVCVNLSADRLENSSFHIMFPLSVAIVGFVIGAATLNTGARYFAMVLMIAGGHGSNSVVVAWTQKTILRPRMKRAAAVAFVNAFGNTAQIFASYMYPNNDAPRYTLAMSVNSGFALGGILLAAFMRMVLIRENKRLQAGQNVTVVMRGNVVKEIEGITEEERIARRTAFRYIA